MQKEKKLRALKAILGDCRRKGEEYIFFCPNHGARAGRAEGQLSVNLETDWFNCWSCSFKSKNLLPLLKKGTDREIIQEYRSELQVALPQDKKEVVKEYDTPSLPPEFKSLSTPSRSLHYQSAIGYLAERGMGLEDILRWKLGYCEEGEYRHRIIIPSFDRHGELNFAVGRSFYYDPRRYKHGNLNKDIIWNEYLIDWKKPVTVTEGPFDAFSVRDNSIALQGTILGNKLFSKIVTTGTDVYFALDKDAFRKQLKMIDLFLSYGIDCFHVDLGGKKDAGEMTRNEFEIAKQQAVSVSSGTDLLRLRITG